MKKFLIKIIPIIFIICFITLIVNGVVLFLYYDQQLEVIKYLEEIEIISSLGFIITFITWIVITL